MNGLGNLGMGQAEGLPATGVEYVVGNQQGEAILRPLRYPMYDAENFPNSLASCRILFAKHSTFADGTNKSLCDRRYVAA